MGENPLPNCVAAMTMVEPGGFVYLIHTDFTQSQAKRLARLLSQDILWIRQVYLLSLQNQQADGFFIRKVIQNAARQLQGRLGMNYTGGTKVMAVHAYRAVFELQPDAVFSYLDPHRLVMCIDNDYGEVIRLRVSPQLSLKQIFALHGLTWQEQRPPESEPLWQEAAQAFAQFHQDSSLTQAWRSWCHSQLRRVAKYDSYQWRSEGELVALAPLSLQGLPQRIRDVLGHYFGVGNEGLSFRQLQQQGIPLQKFCEWLDGLWLEHYVLSQLQVIAEGCRIHESKRSFYIEDPLDTNKTWAKFEFDVAFMRDYQLFALSCTTTDKRHLRKQKLIEANLRARQLGGAEARVALVCCYDWAQYLKTELEVETRNRKIAVFGRQDLGSLAMKIAQWVQQNG
jgi:hypothetical protein